jgi:hypothetical protein
LKDTQAEGKNCDYERISCLFFCGNNFVEKPILASFDRNKNKNLNTRQIPLPSMNSYHRRYVFVDFENLLKVNFKKLGKVCDKVFVFISAKEENIPFLLVQHLQKLGKAVKWVVIDGNSSNGIQHIISFMMGRLHQKVDKMVEFSVLTNEADLDPLISFINQSGRNCLRAKIEKAATEQIVPTEKKNPAFDHLIFNDMAEKGNSGTPAIKSPLTSKADIANFIEHNTHDTVKRLVRSGNRPANLHLLKDYILLQQPDAVFDDYVELVIKKLQQTNDITILEDDVIYNF